jgi:hypothetical protein
VDYQQRRLLVEVVVVARYAGVGTGIRRWPVFALGRGLLGARVQRGERRVPFDRGSPIDLWLIFSWARVGNGHAGGCVGLSGVHGCSRAG